MSLFNINFFNFFFLGTYDVPISFLAMATVDHEASGVTTIICIFHNIHKISRRFFHLKTYFSIKKTVLEQTRYHIFQLELHLSPT